LGIKNAEFDADPKFFGMGSKCSEKSIKKIFAKVQNPKKLKIP
jgi:hypothetical protein